jgi:hypothetical protein
MWQLKCLLVANLTMIKISIDCQPYHNEFFFIVIMQWPKFSCHPLMINVFGHHSCGNKKLSIVNMTISLPSPIRWQLHFFRSPYVFGSLSFDGWWINLHHWFDDWIWFGDKICWCLLIKNKPFNLDSFSFLRCVRFVLFNTNHCHIPWEGRWNFYGCLNFRLSYYICNWC